MDATINFKEGCHLVGVVINEDDGSIIEKTITIENFIDIVRFQEKKTYYCLNSMFEGYEKAEIVKGLLYGEIEGNYVKGIFFVPADIRFMNVAGEKSLMPYPSLVFKLITRNGQLIYSQCFAMREESMNDLNIDSKLYAFPFGNVQAANGHICWGSNNFPDMFEFEELRSAITTFFSSESNMDYVQQGVSYHKKYGNYNTFLSKLRTMSNFPEKALVSSPCVSTLRELIEK